MTADGGIRSFSKVCIDTAANEANGRNGKHDVIDAIVVSGIEAGLSRLSVAANNIANASTPGFERQSVIQSALPDGGTQARVVSAGDDGSLLQDHVNQLTASYAIQASVLSLKVAHDALGTLLDQRA